ncbi:DUF6538 domain-containing protein [Craterilacuibacter sp. RT1T]|uniref:DUF6538 domain-containing protein n=1 Tax=Craterilacuibacter sp. RT1T TaxID=2942211 RepID=UPI0020C0449F|nr:phage integrase SAM-like domain-containing protein [Craterilacuibacter sp. RT1T]
MSKTNYLTRRSGVYYFRRKIPLALQPTIGRKEVCFSLGTKDPKEAERLAREKAVEIDREWASIQQSITTPAIPASELTLSHYEQIQQTFSNAVLSFMESRKVQGISDAEYDEFETLLAAVDSASRKQFTRGNFRAVAAVLEAWAGVLHITLPDRETPAYRETLLNISKAMRHTIQQAKALHAGDLVPIPPRPAHTALNVDPAVSSTNETSWPVLLERWANERAPRSKTLAEWQLYVGRFADLNPDISIEQTEKRHVVAFKDWLVAKDYSPATVEKHLTAIRSLLGWALDNDIITRNPATGVRIAKATNSAPSRQPYSLEDLNAIFSTAIFREGERPKAGRGEAAFWLPLLGLFTGARLEELGQLLCADVRERDQVHFIAISDAEEGQSVKTNSSRRFIPLHPELLRLGFLDYVADQREQGHQRLFHLLDAGKHGAYTVMWSKWYGRFARKPPLNMPSTKVFHSFRHTFKDAARNSGIPKDVHDAFTGHSSGDVGSTYGNGHSLQSLATWMVKLEYPGLQLDFTGRPM